MSSSDVNDVDPVEHDVDLAWELYEAQPSHPEIPRIVHRVLAAHPERSAMRLLLALHLKELDRFAEARQVLHDLLGRNDHQYVSAARDLRDLEIADTNYAEALRWAHEVLRREQDEWLDHLRLGVAIALGEDLERGWDQIDAGVAMCARTEPDSLTDALTHRALLLLMTFAPASRFLDAALEALRADPTDEYLAAPLALAYMHEYRFDEAEQNLLGMLRTDPTDGLAASLLEGVRAVQAKIAAGDATIEAVRASGVMEIAWDQLRADHSGTGLATALEALEPVLPEPLRQALLPPADDETANASAGSREIAAWHDGQRPGTGALWGVDGAFRLMTAAEIAEMDEQIENDPASFPLWDEESYYTQVFTDDAGAYLIEGPRGRFYRRGPEGPDVELAASLADWMWDRVAAFGGRDPRPKQVTSAAEPAYERNPS